jgi:hypothetical protein
LTQSTRTKPRRIMRCNLRKLPIYSLWSQDIQRRHPNGLLLSSHPS